MVKKGFLKKTGCILISASIILAGWTFMGSSVSEAELEEEPAIQQLTDNSGDIAIPDVITEEPTTEEEETSSEGQEGVSDAQVEEPVATEPEVPTEPAEGAADGTEGQETVELETSLVESPRLLRSINPLLLTSSLAATSSSEEESTEIEYSGNTLVKVPAAAGEHVTIKAGTTKVAANAFSGSNVRYLTFEDASLITKIESQGSWPKSGTKVYCPHDEFLECTAVVDFFTPIDGVSLIFGENYTGDTITVTILELYGETSDQVTYTDRVAGDVITPRAHAGYTCSDSYTVTSEETQAHTFNYTKQDTPTAITVTITEVVDGTNYPIVYSDKVAGDTIYPTSRSGYECSDSYKVTSAATQAHTFTYTKKDTPTPTTGVNVTITEVYGKEKKDINYSNQAVGTVIKPTEHAGFICHSTYTVTGEANQAHTFIYAEDRASSGLIVYITEEYGDKSETIQYLGKHAGDVITPTNRESAGYTCSDKYTVTSEKTQIHTFKYTVKQGGGSSGGGSSSGSSGSSGAASQDKDVSNEAKSTSKYVVTEGANQQVKQDAGPIKIVCNGPADKLAYILVDGNKVAKSNYVIQSGSTILTFNKEYVASMPVGDHAVQFQYTDGYAITGLKILSAEAKTTTTVTYKVAADGTITTGHTKDSTPKTADGFDTRYLLCIAIFLMGAGAIMMSKQRKLEALLANQREEY